MLQKLKRRKYYALLGIIALVVGIYAILSVTLPDKYAGMFNVKDTSIMSKSLASVGNAVLDEGEVKGNSTIEYIVSFTLDELDGVETRDAIITGSLTDEESRYARFKSITGTGVTSTLSDEGKNIEVQVQDVRLGVEKKVKLKLVISNAPNGFEIHPIIKVKEATGTFTSLETQNIVVTTNTLEGTVKDETGTPINNIELVLYKDGLEVKRTFSDENGNYVVTDLETGNYKVDVDEEIYELSEEKSSDVSGSSRLDITVKRVEPYTIETHKYIEKLKLVVDGETREYSYDDAEKVVEEIKKAKNLSGEIEYKLVVQNVGEKAGVVTRVEDVASEGLKLKEDNTGWVQVGDKFYYRPIEGSTLSSQEKVEIYLTLEIENTDQAKTYLNKMTAKGEVYEKVVYILDGQVFREEEILEGEYATDPRITTDTFDGWYSDKNKENKYNFDNPVLKDIILYGFTASYKCKVTFIDFGQIYNEQEIDCGTKAIKPADPVHEGYKFDKWLDEDDYEFDPNEPVDRDVTYTSKNDLINYSLRYNYNGGSLPEGQTNPSSYNIETPDFTLKNPSKEGYTFTGWTERNDTTPNINYTIRKGSTGEKEFTAHYEVIPYTITYDLDGGSLEEGKTNPSSYNIETNTFTLNNPSKLGYNFVGWTGTGLNEATSTVTVTKGSMGNRSYKAIYEPITYKIEYNGLTEEEKENLPNPKEYTIESDTINIVNPNNRYDGDGDLSEIFTGWTGSNGDSQSISVSIPHGSTGDKEYTAHFIEADPDIYPITYNLKNGHLAEGESNPSSYTKKTDTFTLYNPSKTGYDFIGWTGTDLSDNTLTVTIPTGSRGERSYEANYNPINYRITYNLDGGSLAEGVSNPTEYNIESADITLNNPTKPGYTFIGWVGTDVPTESTTVTIPTGSTGDREYTAKYVKETYHITYELHGGSLAEDVSNPTEYDIESETITLNNPSKFGYNFTGWTGTGLNELTMTVTIPTGSTGDRSYEAHYDPIVYRITYDLDGGSLAEGVSNPTEYTIESADITLNNPTKEQHRFVGWEGTDLSIITKDVTIPTGSTGDRSYKATYGINAYLVKFINLGSLYQTQRVNYGNSATKPSNNPTSNTNSVFKYWSLENKTIDENPEEYNFSLPILEDTTLYAVYEPVVSPEIVHTPTYWTNQNVTVTINQAKPEYSTFYYVGSTYYPTYSGSFEVEENCDVVGISTYNGVYSDPTIHPITNIDKINPIINNLSASGVTTTEFTINVSAIDHESGIASIMLYKDDELIGTFEYDDEDTAEKINSYTLSNLSENTSYTIKAVAVDKATNRSNEVVKEFSTGAPIVARIIGEDNTMWEEENWINFSSLQAAIEYQDCVNTQCTIQMVTGTNESNIILNGQDITLDLNGQIVRGIKPQYTIQNNGLFTLVDNNAIDKGVLYNSTGTAILNNTDDAVLTLGVNDLEYNVSVEQPRVVGASYGVKKEAGTFNFYDGYIEGVSAIYGIVDDTPYLYNARVSSIVNSDESIKQKAILNIVADAEARIGTVYYTKLSDALDQSKIGTMDATSTIEEFKDVVQTYGEHGFTYQDGSFITDEDNIGESYSVIPIDLTNETDDKVLLVTYNYHTLRKGEWGSTFKYYNDYNTSITVTDELGTYSDYSNTIFDSPEGTNYYETQPGITKSTTTLPKGRKYYLLLRGNVDIYELSIGTETVKYISEYEDIEMDNNALLYGFDYDEETKTYRSNNNFKNATIAFDYIEVDLTDKPLDYMLNVTASLDSVKGRSDYAVIRVSETNDRLTYPGDKYSERLLYLYPSNDYGVGDGMRSQFGPILKNKVLEKGKKYYIQFYYFKENKNTTSEAYEASGSNDEFVINSLEVYPYIPNSEQTLNLSTSFDTVAARGFDMDYNGYRSVQNLYRNEGVVDSFITLDFTNETQDKIVMVDFEQNYYYPQFYMYLTDNPKNLSYQELMDNSSDLIYHAWAYQYDENYYDYIKRYIYLEKGKKYYLHFANSLIGYNTTYGYDAAKIRGVSILTTTDSLPSMYIGKHKVFHGTATRTDAIVEENHDNDLRFVGAKTSNYVSFNNELWRIIGVFNTEDENGVEKPRIKIVRNSYMGYYTFDSSRPDNSNSGYGINEWSQADAMKLMNPGYSDESIGGSLYWNSGSGKCYNSTYLGNTDCDFTENGLKEESKQFIDEVKWNTGAHTSSPYSPIDYYNSERGTATGKDGATYSSYPNMDDVDRTTEWVGKIGLPYVSDFKYSVGDYTYVSSATGEEVTISRSECLSSGNGGCYQEASWIGMISNSYPVFALNPANGTTNAYMFTPGGAQSYGVYTPFNLIPTLYLSNKVIIKSGTGTSENPYTIELGSSVNSDNDYGLVELNQNNSLFIQDETDDHNYRFIGGNPNNYISFNGELWRIIGIFKTKDKNDNESYRIKIMRSSAIGNYSWDSSKGSTNSGYGVNEWSQSDIMKLLNEGYDDNKEPLYNYNSSYNTTDLVNNSLWWNRTSGTCISGQNNNKTTCDFSSSGLTDDAKAYIDKVKWNTGAILYPNFGNLTANEIYDYERGSATAKTDADVPSGYPIDNLPRYSTWIGKVGLPSPSDYIMAAGDGNGYNRETCMTTPGGYGDCSYNNNWMSRDSGVMSSMHAAYGEGAITSQYMFGTSVTLSPHNPYTSTMIKPTVYLSTKTIITGGKGTESNPFTLSLGETDNPLMDKYYGLYDDGSDPVETMDNPIIDKQTDDYTRLRHPNVYGFSYDEETHTFTNDNYADTNSVASTTFEIDLTNESFSKKFYYTMNHYDYYRTFFIVDENPEPINYNSLYPTCYTGSTNCNILEREGSIYLEPGRKYYVHLGYINYDEYSSYNNLFSVTVKIDAGDYNEETEVVEKVVERNSDIDTIQVLKNINLDYHIDIEEERSVKLDLNGYTLTSIVSGSLVRNKGEFEIIDSKVNTENYGKIVNNNGDVITNNYGGNLILTSGRVETNNASGVKNLGNMTMKEDFTISAKTNGIDNTDGVIDDVAGNIITASGGTGINNDRVVSYNLEDSGTLKAMTGPLTITGGTYGIKNTSIVNNVTISGVTYGVYSTNVTDLNVNAASINASSRAIHAPFAEDATITNSTITASNGEAVIVKTTDVISDTDISASNLGLYSEEIGKLKNVNITARDVAIMAGLDDETLDFENVVTDSNIAIDLLKGNLTIDDDFPLEYTGGFINNDNMTIDITNNKITKGMHSGMGIYSLNKTSPCQSEFIEFNIFNNGTMNVVNLPQDNSLNIQNAGTLTGTDLDFYEFGACGNSLSELNNVNINRLKVSNYYYESEGHTYSTVNYTGGSIKVVDNYQGTYSESSRPTINDTIVNLTGLTIGDDTEDTDDILNSGTINLKDSTVNGRLYNRYYGRANLDNTNLTELNNNGYHYYRWYSSNSGSYYYYYYGNTEVNVTNNSTIGTINNGTGYTENESSRNTYYIYDDVINLYDSTVTGETTNYKTGILNNKSAAMNTIENTGKLYMGDKEDSTVYKDVPSAETISNSSEMYFYDGIVRRNEGYPITGSGDIKEVAEGYYLYLDEEDGRKVMYLANDKPVCSIGDVGYPSIGAALASIPDDSEKVTIDVLKTHVTAEKLVNEKNAIVDLHGYTVSEYSGEYLTNNGDLSFVSTGSKGKLIHSDRDYLVLLTGEYRGQDLGKKIINTGKFGYDNIESWSLDFVNDILKDDKNRVLQTGEATISNSYFYNVDNNNINNKLELANNTMEYVTNRGYLHGAGNKILIITNYQDLILDSNVYTVQYPSHIVTYADRIFTDNPTKEVWIKGGKYDNIEQKQGTDSYIPQLVKIGTPSTSVEVVINVKLANGYTEMYNTTIHATEGPALTTSYGPNIINNSELTYNIYYNSKNVTTNAVELGGKTTLVDSTIKCTGTNVNRSNYCNAIKLGRFSDLEITNSTIKGYDAITNPDTIIMNSGIIEADNYGINAGCADVTMVDGSITAGNHAMYLYDSSACYTKRYINIGTNKEHTVVGNPTITSTSGGGIYKVSGKAEINFANGTIESELNSIYALPMYSTRYGSVYEQYPVTINIGTVDVENVIENPTIITHGAEESAVNLVGSSIMTESNYINMQKGSITSQYYGLKIPEGSGEINLGKQGDEDVSKENPYIFSETTSAIYTGGNKIKINFYDGLVKGKIGSSIVGTIDKKETGFVLINKQEDGYDINYLDNPKLAAIGSVEYDTLQDAIDAASNGDTIKLLTDYQYIASMEASEIPEGKNIILDFAGKTVTQKVAGKLYLTNNGTVELKNISSDGTINFINNGTLTYTSGDNTSITNSGNITVNGGKLSIVSANDADNDNVIVNDGTVTNLTAKGSIIVNDGTITSLYAKGITTIHNGDINTLYAYADVTINDVDLDYLKLNSGITTFNDGTMKNASITDGTLNLIGGTISTNDGAAISINGGTLNIGTNDGTVDITSPVISGMTYGINYLTDNGVVNFYDGEIGGHIYPLNGSTNRNYINSVETGYIPVEENKKITLSTDDVIQNTTTGTKYRNIQDALDAASSGDTLKLLKGVVPSIETESYTIGNIELTIDYDGHSIYSKKAKFVNNGELELTSSTAFTSNNKLYYLSVENNNKFTMDGLITGNVDIINNTNTESTISNTTSENISINNSGIMNNDTWKFNNATITNSGTLNNTNCTSTKETITNTGSINIDGSKSDEATINNQGTLNISNVSYYKIKTITNSNNVTFADSSLSYSNITNNGNITVNNTTIYSPVIKNNATGTIDFNSGKLQLISDASNFKNKGISNFNGLVMNTVFIENEGTLNILGGNHTYVNTSMAVGTVVIKNSVLAEESSSNVSVIKAGTLTVENSSFASSRVSESASFKDITESTIGISLEAGTTLTADNSKVTAELEGENTTITATNGSTLYLSGAAKTDSSGKYTKVSLKNTVINITDSTLDQLFISKSNNYGDEPYDINVYANNSVIRNIINRYNYYDVTHTRPSYWTETVYEDAAHVHVYAEDTEIRYIEANSLEMKNGTLKGDYDENHTSNYNISTPESCKFDNTTIEGELKCATVELKSSDVPGNVEATTSLTSENSTIDGNLTGGGNYELTNSTITGSMNGYNVTMSSSDVNNGVKCNKITLNVGTIAKGIVANNSATIVSGTVTNDEGTGITAPSVSLGTDDSNVSTTDPVITGTDKGIDSSYLYYYDGIITGTLAADTNRAYYPANYKMNIIVVSGKQILTLTPIGQDEVVAETDNKFYADLQAAFNDCVNGGTVKLHRDVTLTETVIISDDKSIIIDLNNHQIVNIEYIQGNYTTTDSTNPEIGGAIYRFLAGIFGYDTNPRNIVIYQMEDGDYLHTEQTYKLFKLNSDNEYEIVKVNEEEIGEYTIGNDVESMNVIKGKLYLNGIGTGTYKLVSNTNRELDFDIYDDSVSSNIRINNSLPNAKVTSSAVATLILTFGTGMIRTPWIIIILLLVIITTGFIIIRKKMKA